MGSLLSIVTRVRRITGRGVDVKGWDGVHGFRSTSVTSELADAGAESAAQFVVQTKFIYGKSQTAGNTCSRNFYSRQQP